MGSSNMFFFSIRMNDFLSSHAFRDFFLKNNSKKSKQGNHIVFAVNTPL